MSRPVRQTGQELADEQSFIKVQKLARKLGKAGKSWNTTMVALYRQAPSFISELSNGGLETIKLEWGRGTWE